MNFSMVASLIAACSFSGRCATIRKAPSDEARCPVHTTFCDTAIRKLAESSARKTGASAEKPDIRSTESIDPSEVELLTWLDIS